MKTKKAPWGRFGTQAGVGANRRCRRAWMSGDDVRWAWYRKGSLRRFIRAAVHVLRRVEWVHNMPKRGGMVYT